MALARQIGYVSGKIETKAGQCFVDDQVVDCPSRTVFGLEGTTESGIKLDILPSNFVADTRNDPLFYGLLVAIILTVFLLSIFKLKIFGKTLGEYAQPIWLLIGICLLVVAWQYLVGEKLAARYWLQVSQWIWELAIIFSAYHLTRRYQDFNFGNMVVLAILFSLIIHGTKVTIRYIFYDRTLLYILDRFLYGSLLVMVIILGLGTVFLLTRQKSRHADKL